jgi:hypothetical protein
MDEVLLAFKKLPRRDKLKGCATVVLCIWAYGLAVRGSVDCIQLQQVYLCCVCKAHASSDTDGVPASLPQTSRLVQH